MPGEKDVVFGCEHQETALGLCLCANKGFDLMQRLISLTVETKVLSTGQQKVDLELNRLHGSRPLSASFSRLSALGG